MQGRLENQIKAENAIKILLKDLPREVNEYYINFSTDSEFRSCLSYIQKLKRFILWYCEENNIKMSSINFNKITDIDIAKYMKKAETKETKNGSTYTSFSYRKQIWSTLNSFFKFLYEKNKIDQNPVSKVKRSSKDDDVKHVFLEKEDLDKMIDSVKDIIRNDKFNAKWGLRDLAILYTFIFTGMRESALCEIDLNKIDFDNGTIEVIDKGHKVNTYTISETLKKSLQDWINERKKIMKDCENDALFISNQKTRITQQSVIRIVNKYSEKVLGQKVSPHRLRAAYGNIIYNQTHDIELTSKAMKHKNISTTRIYMKNDEKKVNDKVANIMSNLF